MSEACNGEVCDGSGYFNGRVDHVRLVMPEPSYTPATYAVERDFWTEGTGVPCPACHAEMYGRVTKITKREG
jgi:hypothetical protein